MRPSSPSPPPRLTRLRAKRAGHAAQSQTTRRHPRSTSGSRSRAFPQQVRRPSTPFNDHYRFLPWIFVGLFALAIASHFYFNLLNGVVGLVTKAPCFHCPSYLTRLDAFGGPYNFCRMKSDSTLSNPRRQSRHTDMDGGLGYNWTLVNENRHFAEEVLANFSVNVESFALETTGLELPFIVLSPDSTASEFWNSSYALSRGWTIAAPELVGLLESHETSMALIKSEVSMFRDHAGRHYKDLRDCGQFRCLSPSSWLTRILGLPNTNPMKRLEDDVEHLANADLRARVEGLKQQTQRFSDTVKKMDDDRHRIGREWQRWSRMCAENDAGSIWRHRTIRKKHPSGSLCALDLERLRSPLQQDIDFAFGALETFIGASDFAYKRLIREYGSVVRVVQDAKPSANTYRSFDFQSHMGIFERARLRIERVNDVFEKVMGKDLA